MKTSLLILLSGICCSALAGELKPAPSPADIVSSPTYMSQLTVNNVLSTESGRDAQNYGDTLNVVLSVNHIECIHQWSDSKLLYSVDRGSSVQRVQLDTLTNKGDELYCDGHPDRKARITLYPNFNTALPTISSKQIIIFKTLVGFPKQDGSMDTIWGETRIELNLDLKARKIISANVIKPQKPGQQQ